MTVTLELPPDMEADLSERAAERGQAIQDYFLTLAVDDLYIFAEMSAEEQQEVVKVLQERQHDHASGEKSILLEDWWAGVSAKREARANQTTGGNFA